MISHSKSKFVNKALNDYNNKFDNLSKRHLPSIGLPGIPSSSNSIINNIENNNKHRLNSKVKPNTTGSNLTTRKTNIAITSSALSSIYNSNYSTTTTNRNTSSNKMRIKSQPVYYNNLDTNLFNLMTKAKPVFKSNKISSKNNFTNNTNNKENIMNNNIDKSNKPSQKYSMIKKSNPFNTVSNHKT